MDEYKGGLMLSIKEGSVIASKYKVIKKIGSGGNGTVFKVVSLNNESNFLALKNCKFNYNKYYNKRYSVFCKRKFLTHLYSFILCNKQEKNVCYWVNPLPDYLVNTAVNEEKKISRTFLVPYHSNTGIHFTK